MDLVVTGTTATFGQASYKVAIGRSGFSSQKVEGDGTTPVGTFPVRKLYYRKDRIQLPSALQIEATALTPRDGWCDDPDSPHYNCFVKLPFKPSHEKLWKDDTTYDLILVMGHNDDPVEPGKGSAVFTHIAREGYTPTQGCLAFSQKDLLKIVSTLTPSSKIIIQG